MSDWVEGQVELHFLAHPASRGPLATRVVQTPAGAVGSGLCAAVAELALDDSSGDNRDDSGSLKRHRYGPKTSLSCLVR